MGEILILAAAEEFFYIYSCGQTFLETQGQCDGEIPFEIRFRFAARGEHRFLRVVVIVYVVQMRVF